MNEIHSLDEVYKNLSSVLGNLNRETWRKMRRLVGVQPFQTKCTQAQWIKLLAYAALRRSSPTKRIDDAAIRDFIAETRGNPLSYFPGFVSTSVASFPADGCWGSDLKEVIWNHYRLDIPASTLDRYCRQVLGRGLSMGQTYSPKDIHAIASHRGKQAAGHRSRSIAAGKKLVAFNQRKRESQAFKSA